MVESAATIQSLYLRNLFIYLLWLLWFVSSPYIWLSGVALAFIGGAHIGLQPAWGCSQDVRVHIFIFLGVPEPLFTSANHHQRGGRVHYALLLRHSPQPLQPHLCLTLGVAMLDGDLNLAGFKTLNLKKLPHNLSWQWRAISSKVNWVFSSAACGVWWNIHFHHNFH